MLQFVLRETLYQGAQGKWNDRWKVSYFEESFEVSRKGLYVKCTLSGTIKDVDKSLKNYIAGLLLTNIFKRRKIE